MLEGASFSPYFLASYMPIEKTAQFSLEQHNGAYETWPRLSRLFSNGADTHRSITGYQIEAQYTCDASYLLITSMDCMFEESNHFFLLDRQFNTIATKNLIPFYNTYLIMGHWPLADNAIRLHYHDDTFYTLSIKARAIWFGGNKRLELTPFEDFKSDAQCVQSMEIS